MVTISIVRESIEHTEQNKLVNTLMKTTYIGTRDACLTIDNTHNKEHQFQNFKFKDNNNYNCSEFIDYSI